MDGLIKLILLALFFKFIIFLLNRLTPKLFGRIGEEKVSIVLDFLKWEYLPFDNVIVKTPSGTTQIDHVIVSPYGVFVIETKNYSGWIYGEESQKEWIQCIGKNKRRFKNPIHQNYGHIKALERILPHYHENQFISIVVFMDRADLKSDLPDNCNVVYYRNLKKKIYSFDEPILSREEEREIIKSIKENQLKYIGAGAEHVQNIKKNIRNNNKMIKEGKCPKCGSPLVERNGKFGAFYGCSSYPRCKFIKK